MGKFAKSVREISLRNNVRGNRVDRRHSDCRNVIDWPAGTSQVGVCLRVSERTGGQTGNPVSPA